VIELVHSEYADPRQFFTEAAATTAATAGFARYMPMTYFDHADKWIHRCCVA